MKSRFLLVLAGLLSVLGALLPGRAQAQGSIPFTINNTSPFLDGDLYVAIVGIDPNKRHVWLNADIVAAYKANVPAEFQGTVNNATGVISYPSKTAAFYDGSNGTTPGPYANYFKAYLDAIWSKYQNEDLIFNAGNAGVFKGRVGSDNRLVLVGQSGAYNGRTGIITREPTTQEAFEGKGVLAQRNNDGDCDLVVQAQLTAAVNRHALTVAGGVAGQQDFYNVSKFYQTPPFNYYARFWHLPGISVNNLSYGFAYDDVADQSATLHTAQPTKVVATFGGWAGQTPPPPGLSGDPNLAGVYTLQNRLSGLNLDVNGASQADRARVQQYPANTCTCQQFRFEHLGNGLYKITAQHSGKVLDVNYVSPDNGAAIVQWPDASGGNEQFYAIGTDGGYYKLIAKHSGKAVEVAGLSTANLAIVQQWTDNGEAQQQWKLNPVGTPPPPTGSSAFIEAEKYSAFNNAQLETCTDQGGGQDVGYLKPGSWLAYNNIRFPTTGTYTIEYRVASATNGGRFGAELSGGAIQLGLVDVPNTGGWQTWRTITQQVQVTAGTYNFGLNVKVGDWNINWLRITSPNGARLSQTLAAAPAAAAAPDLLGAPLSIHNATGQVWHGTYDGAALNVATLAPGLYVLTAAPASGPALTRRFSKQ